MASDIAIPRLQDLLTPGRVKTDPATLQVWGEDWTRSYDVAPSAVVFPESVEEVIAVVGLANELGFALVPSGGRTGLSGGAVAPDGEVVLSLDRLNRIIEFNPIDRMVTCQAGVVTGAIHAFAAENSLHYPVDFAASGSSQIGGNVATNAGGIRVIRHGLTRDWVAGLRVVTGSGELLDCNAGLLKNATGYDLRHLFVGSEGTLGIIVEVDVHLTRPPKPQTVMVLGAEGVRQIVESVNRFRSAINLSACEFFSHNAMERVTRAREAADPLSQPCAFYTLLEFDSEEDDKALEAFEACLEEGWIEDGVVSQSSDQANALWVLREGISESIAPQTPYKNDVSVRPSRMADFLEEAQRLVETAYPEFEVCWYGHIGDGNLHLNILRPDSMDPQDFYATCHAISPRIFDLVTRHRGSISAEHGVGLLKRDYLSYSRSATEIALMRRIKDQFDPKGILNPGKLFPDADP